VKSTIISVTADGKQLAATIAIDAAAEPGPRVARVSTPNGVSSWKAEGAVFTVAP
jgi:hypothetical protein